MATLQHRALPFVNGGLIAFLVITGWQILPVAAIILAVALVGVLFMGCRRLRSAAETFVLAFPLGLLVVGVLSLALGVVGFGILSRVVFWLALIALSGAALVRLVRTGSLRAEALKRTAASANVLGFLLVAVIVLLTYGHLLSAPQLPRTDAPGYLERALFARESLDAQHRIGTWYPDGQLGYPIYTFDPPLFFVWYGIAGHLLPHAHAILLFNQLFFVSILWIGFGAYVLLRRSVPWLPSALGAGLSVAIPYLAIPAFLSGNIKLFLAYAGLLPFLVVAYEGKRGVLAGALLAFIALSHASLAPLAGVLLLLFAAGRALKTRAFAGQLRFVAVAVATALLFGAFFVGPLLVYRAQGWSAPTRELQFTLPAMHELAGAYAGEPARAIDGKYGLLLGLATLASLGIVVWLKPRGMRFVLSCLGGFALTAAVGSIALLAPILVEYSRLEPALLLFYGAVMGIAAGALLQRSRSAGVTGCIVLAGLLLFYAPVTAHRTTELVGEHLLSGELAQPNPQLLALEKEYRFTTYGPPALPFHAAMAAVYGMPTNGYGFRQGQHTDLWYTQIYDLTREGPPEGASGVLIFNLLRATNTRYVWADRCLPGGKAAYDLFVEDCLTCGIKQKDIHLKGGEGCVVLLYLPNATFVESAPVYYAGEDVRAVYGQEGAANAVYLAEPLSGIPAFDSTVLESLEEPQPLAFARPNGQEIRIAVPAPGWVHVKEEAFPRWRASLDGRQLPIRKTNLGLMAVDVHAAGTLVLKNAPLWWEKLLAAISGGFLLALFIPWKKRKR